MEILEPAAARLHLASARPPTAAESQNEGCTMLVIDLTPEGNETAAQLAVLLTPRGTAGRPGPLPR